jgi:hypothetical protein
MRPTSIRLFEMSVIASQLIRIAVGLLFSARLADVVGVPRSGLLVGTLANVAVELGLGLAISRGRMSLARWFLLAIIVLDLLNAVGLPDLASMIGTPFAVFSALAILLMLVAGVLMFVKPSSDWLKQRAQP